MMKTLPRKFQTKNGNTVQIIGFEGIGDRDRFRYIIKVNGQQIEETFTHKQLVSQYKSKINETEA